MFDLNKEFLELAQLLLRSTQIHAWYLSWQLVIVALTDTDVEEDEKKKILQNSWNFKFLWSL